MQITEKQALALRDAMALKDGGSFHLTEMPHSETLHLAHEHGQCVLIHGDGTTEVDAC